MRSIFNDDFFKNLIGFATILLISIGVTMFANATPVTDQAATAEEEGTTIAR